MRSLGWAGRAGLLLAAVFAFPAAAEENADQGDAVETTAGIWYQPATGWAGKTSGDTGNTPASLHYNINDSPTTTYEGSFFDKNRNLAAGLSVDVDNNAVGKLKHIMGFVGFKGWYVRLQKSNLVGTADWQGATPLPGQPQTFAIHSTYQSADLLRQSESDPSLFYGLGYSTVTLPQQISVWGNIGTVYTNFNTVDPASKLQVYSLVFGMDTLNWASIKRESGWGFWAFTQDRFGLGHQSVSPAAAQQVSAFFGGGRSIPGTFVTSLIDYTLTLGAKWEYHTAQSGLGLGVGYNFHGMIYNSGWNVRGAGANDLDAYSNTLLTGSGPQIKLIGTW